jgi:hypothetical protein
MDRIVLYCVLALATLSPVEFLGVSAGFGLAGGGFRPGSAEQERCPKDQIPVKVTVKVELMENAVLEDYTHYKESRSQSSFKERYDELDVSASVYGGIAGFSAGASAAYRDVASSADSSTESREVEKTRSTRFNPEFLQLFQIVTRTLHIGATFSTTTTRDWIDSVRIDRDMSFGALKQLAEKVVEREYGHITTGQVQGSTFTERTCMIKKAFVHTDRSEHCSDRGFMDLSTASECSAAVNYAMSHVHSNAYFGQVVNLSHYAKGCFMGESGDMHFNSHSTGEIGTRRGYLIGICKKGSRLL